MSTTIEVAGIRRAYRATVRKTRPGVRQPPDPRRAGRAVRAGRMSTQVVPLTETRRRLAAGHRGAVTPAAPGQVPTWSHAFPLPVRTPLRRPRSARERESGCRGGRPVHPVWCERVVPGVAVAAQRFRRVCRPPRPQACRPGGYQRQGPLSRAAGTRGPDLSTVRTTTGVQPSGTAHRPEPSEPTGQKGAGEACPPARSALVVLLPPPSAAWCHDRGPGSTRRASNRHCPRPREPRWPR